MSEIKVSIIVPCYGVEKYLDRCMESLVHQTLSEIEIILVDDKSVDATPGLCDKWAELDSRVLVIHKEVNEGLGYTRNTGLRHAHGEYIAFVDSDDFVDVNMYKTLYEKSSADNLDVCYCGHIFHSNNCKDVKISPCHNPTIIQGKDACVNLLCKMIDRIMPFDINVECSVWHGIYRSSVFKEYDIEFCSEREYISEDVVFHVDYLNHTQRIAILPYCGYYYCENENSLTHTYRPSRFHRDMILCEEVERRMNKYGVPNAENVVDGQILSRAKDSFSYISNKNRVNPLSELKMALDEPLLQRAISEYEIKKLGLVKKIFITLIRFRMSLAILIFYRIRRLF